MDRWKVREHVQNLFVQRNVRPAAVACVAVYTRTAAGPCAGDVRARQTPANGVQGDDAASQHADGRLDHVDDDATRLEAILNG